MAEFPAGQERLLRQLISTRRCRVCRRTYDSSQVRFAAKDDELWIVSARCSACRHQQVFYVMPRADAAEQHAEIPSDVPAVGDPLTSDDVLDMHLFLDEFDGDFEHLFGVV